MPTLPLKRKRLFHHTAVLAAGLAIMLFVPSSVAQSEGDFVIGAGAHFSWLVFNKMKNNLEEVSGKKLKLYGEGSMLGVGCKAGIKTAKKSRPDAESFGFVCCPLTNKEIDEQEIMVHNIAKEPIMILINKSNRLKGLSDEQVKKIFSGEISNWQDVGGKNESIILVTRLHCKGRPGHWKKILPSEENFSKRRINVSSAEEMVETMNVYPNAIGHIGSAWDFKFNDKVKPLSIDGSKPTAENIASGKYPYFRVLSAVTNRRPSQDLLKIIRYAQTSEEFLDIAKEYELLPLIKQ